ncbi:MAG TPA: DUF11 domain-containing protein [Candidatus Gemmiger avistercoris]|uniref:DUF11 domain-containing protein n=1 Tax=Candidatus Gemmiger avistercoris TaxID=2838606 RepID=A0A9D2JPX9_9FIRM|nr:DUF11 domain-containing protein [Candidatus Gemmiger avistercoris]
MRFWKKRLQRVAAMVCSVALAASMMPTAAFATEPEPTPTPEPTPVVETAPTPEPSESPVSTDAAVTTPAPGTGTGSTSAPSEEPTVTPDDTTAPSGETTETTDSTTVPGEEGTETTDSTTVPSEEPVESPEPVQQPEKVLMASAPALQADENGKTIVEAVDGTAENFYADPDNMVWLSVSGGTNISDRQNVTFILNVDGQKETEIEVRGVNRSQAQLRINAPQYDISAEKEGNNVLVECTWNDAEDCYNISNNSYTDTTGDADAYTVVINLTTPTLKDNDAIRIENGGTYYGTFFWAKGTASKSDYKRPLEVYVDDELVYTTTIETPELLTEGSASFWFEANLAQYTSNVTVEPRSLDTVLNKTVKVYLTTKCACGQPNCQCPGGCDCELGCTKPECNPGQGENEISTPYGTISYDPDALGAVKRSLEVEIYVNGQKEYETSEALTVSGSVVGGLSFDTNDTKGYYFHSQAATVNSYDILVRDNADDEWQYVSQVADGSSWTPGTGNITLVYDKEYKLRIYLYTFDRYMTLDVTRVNGTDDYVEGYTISYMARDPETGEEKLYTYPATSFAAGQPQIIPYGREVTVTADCVPYYEATTWRADRDGTDLEFIGEQGNNGSNVSPLRAYGNTVWFTEYGTSDDQLQLYIEGVKEIVPPSDDEMQNLLGDAAVKVSCTTKPEEHFAEQYALKSDSYEKASQMGGNSVDNYTYTITVKPDAYVEDYKSKYSDHSDATPATQEIVFEYVAGKWKVQTETPVTFSVTCEDSKIPDVDVDELGDEVVTIKCTNTATSHPEMKSAILGDLITDYSVAYGADRKTATITINSADKYVEAYNTVHGKPQHTASQISDDEIKVYYDENAKQWTVDTADSTATVEVTCKDTANESVALEKTILSVERDGKGIVFNDGDMLKVGDVVTYQIKVTNDGDTNLSNVTVTDTFNGAGGLSFGIVGNGSIKMNDNGFTWTSDVTLAPGKSNTLTYTYTVVDADKGNTITNAATVNGDGDDPTDEDETETEVENPAVGVEKNLVQVKRGEEIFLAEKGTIPEELEVGDELTYEIEVKNIGNVKLNGLTLTDTFNGHFAPSKVKDKVANVELTNEWEKDTTTGLWTLKIENISPDVGEIETYTYTYIVNQADAGKNLTNTAAVTGDELDPENPPEDKDEHEVTNDGDITLQPADITIYMGGEDGYAGAAGGDSSSLPEPGFYITLPADVENALKTELGLEDGAAADLSKIITGVTATTADGQTRSWTMQMYGDSASTAWINNQKHFVYRIVPGENQPAISVNFTKEDGTLVQEDTFTLTDSLSETYLMSLNTAGVDVETISLTFNIKGEIFHCGYDAKNSQKGTLTVRYTTTPDAPTTPAAQSDAELQAKIEANPDSYYVQVAGSNQKFYINEKSANEDGVDVTAEDVSLLVDSLVGGEDYAYTNELYSKAVTAAGFKSSGVWGQYLDLVDAENGNAWLTPEGEVTVFWPYPAGVTKDTGTIKLYHFEGLDRDMATGDVMAEINNTDADEVPITRLDDGFTFTTSSFSPFVLVQDTTQPSGGEDKPSGGDDGNNDNNNNNTNTNNQTTTVNVANQAAAPAAAPAAVSVPQTSDDMPIGALTAAAVAAAAALVGLLVVRKRRQK